MKVDAFDFDLPADLIAQSPAVPREAARLLHVGSRLEDHHVSDLPGLLRPGDLMVFNDTRVIPARLTGERGEARVEVTLHKALEGGRWAAFARPAKRLRANDEISFSDDLCAQVIEKRDGGEVVLDFGLNTAALFEALHRYGRMPLPPYIKRPSEGNAQDRQDYQTMFAARDGAVAAPTAGLHFTPDLMEALKAAGIETATLTLHVGAGTFLPVKADRVEDHVMHAEFGEIDAATAARLRDAKAAGRRIVAVGTTVVRLLETAAAPTGEIMPFVGDTAIFITPGFSFKAVDVMLTNFHLPRSTLFMLVCAFAGIDRMKAAYRHAIAQRYRFYSYGDCCLLDPAENA